MDQDGRPHITRLSMDNVTVQLTAHVGLYGREARSCRRSEDDLGFVAPRPHTRVPLEGRVAAYTRAYGLRTPPADGRLEIGIFYEHVIFVRENGDNPIPDSGLVLSIPTRRSRRQRQLLEEAHGIRVGHRAKMRVHPNAALRERGCQKIMEAVSGLQVLCWDRKRGTHECIPDDFFAQPHRRREWQEDWQAGVTPPTQFTYEVLGKPAPRTAVGLDRNGRVVLAVLDGQQGLGHGFTLHGVPELMAQLGCVEALNLDGGGSSEAVVLGQVANEPSDIIGGKSTERLMPMGLVVVPARLP